MEFKQSDNLEKYKYLLNHFILNCLGNYYYILKYYPKILS